MILNATILFANCLVFYTVYMLLIKFLKYMMDKNSREMNQIPQLIAANLQVTSDR